MWIANEASVRAGRVTGAQWDTRGDHSVAFGLDNVADDPGSATLGGNVNAIAVGADDSTIGGGTSNVIAVAAIESFVGAGLINSILSSLRGGIVSGESNTIASSDRGFIGAGQENVLATALQGVIGGGQLNTIAGPGSDNGVIGGGATNTISGSAAATIAGGNLGTITASDEGTIGGGIENVITLSPTATIAGGTTGTISQSTSAVIGGGELNTFSSSPRSVIAGGFTNTIVDSETSVISGGSENTISAADFAASPGGQLCEVNADYSHAQGRQAKAEHAGVWIWADSQAADFSSIVADEFPIRARGGIRLGDLTHVQEPSRREFNYLHLDERAAQASAVQAETVVEEWNVNLDDVPVNPGSLIAVRLSGIISRTEVVDNTATFRVRVGGTIGAVDGTIRATVSVDAGETQDSNLGASFANPGGQQLVKITIENSEAGGTGTIRGSHIRIG